MNAKSNPRSCDRKSNSSGAAEFWPGRAHRFKTKIRYSRKSGSIRWIWRKLSLALEQELKVDPFRKAGSPIRTFGDLVRAYQKRLETSS